MRNQTYVNSMEEIFENKESKAKEFSEGNSHLENVLLKLWDMGLKTVGCCASHPTEEKNGYVYHSDPCVAFRYDEDFDTELRLISSINKNLINHIDFSIAKPYLSLGIYGIKEYVNEFFDDVYNIDDNIKRIMTISNQLKNRDSYDESDTFGVDIVYNNGNVEKIALYTNISDIAKKLTDHYEYTPYEYSGRDYYSFEFKDFSFLDYLSIDMTLHT